MKKVFLIVGICLSLILVGCGANTAKYKEDLQSVADDMLESAAEVEGILNQYSKIWRFSIENRSPIPVSRMMSEIGLDENTIREYFQINNAGNIPNDFSINVNSLIAYFEGIGKFEEIKNASKDIKSKVSQLNRPPSDYEKAYEELLDMYTYYEEFIEMALSPKGNLQSFNEDKNKIASDILSKHKRIEIIMPVN